MHQRKNSRLRRAAQCPSTPHLVSGNLKEYLSKAPYKVLKCVVLQHPGSQGCTAHGSLITRCVLFRGTLKVLLITRPGRRKGCREVFCSKSLGEEGLSGEGEGRQGLRRCLRGSCHAPTAAGAGCCPATRSRARVPPSPEGAPLPAAASQRFYGGARPDCTPWLPRPPRLGLAAQRARGRACAGARARPSAGIEHAQCKDTLGYVGV